MKQEKTVRYLILLFSILIQSCKFDNPEILLIPESDSNEKFEIGIPEKWHIEKKTDEGASIIIFSDTSKIIDSVVVFNIAWNDWEVFLNDHLERSLDSLNNIAGIKSSNKLFSEINEFDSYQFEVNQFDTLNQLDFHVRNYFLKVKGQKDCLTLNIRTYKEQFTKDEAKLIERILKTIKKK